MTRDGITIKQGAVVLIPFPYSNLSQFERRPAVILSNKEYNRHNEDLICSAITSNPRNYTYSITLTKEDFIEGSLPLESVVKPNKVFTLKQTLVIKNFGQVSAKKVTEIVSKLNLAIKVD